MLRDNRSLKVNLTEKTLTNQESIILIDLFLLVLLVYFDCLPTFLQFISLVND